MRPSRACKATSILKSGQTHRLHWPRHLRNDNWDLWHPWIIGIMASKGWRNSASLSLNPMGATVGYMGLGYTHRPYIQPMPRARTIKDEAHDGQANSPAWRTRWDIGYPRSSYLALYHTRTWGITREDRAITTYRLPLNRGARSKWR